MQRRSTPPGAQQAPDSAQFLSEPIPIARCIRWNPLPDSYHLLAELLRAPRDEYKLLVSQDVLRHVDTHLRAATAEVAQFYQVDPALVPPCGGALRPDPALLASAVLATSRTPPSRSLVSLGDRA